MIKFHSDRFCDGWIDDPRPDIDLDVLPTDKEDLLRSSPSKEVSPR